MEQPDDYEVCGTCGFDHAYDFPVLSQRTYREAMLQHVARGEIVETTKKEIESNDK